jgi:tetrahydromethanopterin S-methyltransferase subunit B
MVAFSFQMSILHSITQKYHIKKKGAWPMKLFKWTIGKKMFLMGFGIVLALGALGGMFYYTTTMIQQGTAASALRNQQFELINNIEQSVLTLILAAMDSIIDKDEGKISEERMQIINEQTAYVEANLDNLTEFTDEEVRLAHEIRDTFPKLQADIQETLVPLIEESAGELQQIQQDFIQIDDTLDLYGDQIEQDLGTIMASVQQEQADATNLSLLRNQQMVVLDQFLRAHAALMLEAMDAIIDKDSGKIAEDRLQNIQTNITFIQTNLKQLEDLADTEIEAAAATKVREVFPKLQAGIQESAGELQQIRQDFIQIDDTLNIYGDQIEADLETLVLSVQQEQTDATSLALLRNQQMMLLNSFLRAHATLMLEAMDSIIDKDAGQIAPARMENITASIEFMQTNMDKLEALADTDEETVAAAAIRETFPQLVDGIQSDLVRLIRQFAPDDDFERIDDRLDNYGGQIEENLATIFTSVQQEQVDATELSLLRNQQMDLLTHVTESHSNLMLAAMDSIIDKDEGRIHEERMQSMTASIQFINDSLDKLDELADTEEEELAVQSIREIFPKLVTGIQTDLVMLIENSAVKAQQIEADFVRIDDELDEYGDQIEDSLGVIFASVQQEQVDATELSLLRGCLKNTFDNKVLYRRHKNTERS